MLIYFLGLCGPFLFVRVAFLSDRRRVTFSFFLFWLALTVFFLRPSLPDSLHLRCAFLWLALSRFVTEPGRFYRR